MGFGDATDFGQALDRPGLVRRGVHAVPGAQQAAQQGRILQGIGTDRRWGRGNRLAFTVFARGHKFPGGWQYAGSLGSTLLPA